MDEFTKLSGETITVAIDFEETLQLGDVITSNTIEVSDINGDIVLGIATESTINSPKVYITLTGGILGTEYVIKTTASTSDSLTIINEVLMIISKEVPIDQLTQDVKVLVDTDEEDRFLILMPIVVNAICNYCNNDFIMRTINGYVTDNVSMVFSTNTIVMTTTIPVIVGDYIRVYGSAYNDSLYKIIEIDGTTYKIDKLLRSETANCTLALVELPVQFTVIISNYITSIMNNTDNVSYEKVDEVEYRYFKSGQNAFLTQNSSILNQYRRLYADRRWLS